MTIKELKDIFERFDDDATIIIFDAETSTIKDFESVCVNGNAIQLNTEVFE